MGAKVTAINEKCESLLTMVHRVIQDHAEAKSGIVVVFDDKGGVYTYMCCNDQELAFAGSRLLHIANHS